MEGGAKSWLSSLESDAEKGTTQRRGEREKTG
jgi:hypothetical protein